MNSNTKDLPALIGGNIAKAHNDCFYFFAVLVYEISRDLDIGHLPVGGSVDCGSVSIDEDSHRVGAVVEGEAEVVPLAREGQ